MCSRSGLVRILSARICKPRGLAVEESCSAKYIGEQFQPRCGAFFFSLNRGSKNNHLVHIPAFLGTLKHMQSNSIQLERAVMPEGGVVVDYRIGGSAIRWKRGPPQSGDSYTAKYT